MRLIRPRFTVRRLMIGVAIAAILLGGSLRGSRLWKRSEFFGSRAASHEVAVKRLSRHVFIAEYALKTRTAEFEARMWATQAEFSRKQLAHHRNLARKYRRAAARPWLRVANDPPEPTLADGRVVEPSRDAAAEPDFDMFDATEEAFGRRP